MISTLGTVVLSFTVAVLARTFRKSRILDAGSVSESWLSRHRVDDPTVIA